MELETYTRKTLIEKTTFMVSINYNVNIDAWYGIKDKYFHHLDKFQVRFCRDNTEIKKHFNVTVLFERDYEKVFIITKGHHAGYGILRMHCNV